MNMKRCSCILMCVFLLCSLCIPVSAEWDTLEGVKPDKQGDTLWCWAASALIAGRYKYPSTTATQRSIVEHIKGSVVNKSGNIYETANAVDYVTNKKYEANPLLGTYELFAIARYIGEYCPVIALCSSGLSGGHYYVIYGVDIATNRIKVVDPWTGNVASCDWDEFCNGGWKNTANNNNVESRAYSYTVYFPFWLF